MIVVGDKKSPPQYNFENVKFLDLADQVGLFPDFAKKLPLNSYSRKNIGYLYAIQFAPDIIIETDDDNYPYNTFPMEWNFQINGDLVDYDGWGNIYSLFTDHHVWPRGLPLGKINVKKPVITPNQNRFCPIQQYLADGDPDVDAIYRLIFPQKDIIFKKREPVILARGSYAPFNSQNTIWFYEAFKLMYIPSYVSFRVADIWRSFVAQICLHAVGMNLSFHSATVYQKRNIHNLMKDFIDEVPGYIKNEDILKILLSQQLSNKKGEIELNLIKCWKILSEYGIVPEREVQLCEMWVDKIINLLK